jgi:hypothetical protein
MTDNANMRPPMAPPPAPQRQAQEPQQPQNGQMGPQSQRRITLQARTHQLQASSHRNKRKTRQPTLFGDRAFDPVLDCKVCKSKASGGKPSHKAHDPRCYINKRTKGKDAATLAAEKAARQLQQHFDKPLSESEKYSSKYVTPESTELFFLPRTMNKDKAKQPSPSPTFTRPSWIQGDNDKNDKPLSAEDLCSAVTEKVCDSAFIAEHKDSKTPLAMLAFATVVADQIIRRRGRLEHHFDGLTITVPDTRRPMHPQYHSIVGQKLLNVDWQKMFGLEITCPHCGMATLCKDRSNFSKNKLLFPIFVIDGPPYWCMNMSMTCPECKVRLNANSAEILAQIPEYARAAYPVEAKYATGFKHSHIGQSATDVFDLLMTTYGNGELCSRLLYNALNRSYVAKVASYYSFYNCRSESTSQMATALPYIQKDGEYIKAFPPSGDGIRSIYDAAASSPHNSWGISDHDRHTREIQAVGCDFIFAQDHTHSVTKNYFQRQRLKANALWDVATETGEIASAVLVHSTRTCDHSHAAIQLSKRSNFKPSAMYSDTWPAKSDYWDLLFPTGLQGRLGLFHFIQRITRTLRKTHPDHFLAVNSLLNCIYRYEQGDYDRLLKALREGTLSETYSDDDIVDLKQTKVFRQRYGKYLRKEIRPSNIICSMLDDWFKRFKCSSSDPLNPGGGRKDPMTGDTLFTSETKPAVTNCKDKACYLQDPLPTQQMYHEIAPSPNSKHGLTEYLSRRGESKLESFHGILAHFGNCGMRRSLVDNLNLTGTARHNMLIRHKLRLARGEIPTLERKRLPAVYEGVLPYTNHSELNHINGLARACGITSTALPFQHLEMLPADNGERFFSEYLTWVQQTVPKYNTSDLCLCASCDSTTSTANANSGLLAIQAEIKMRNGEEQGATVPAVRASSPKVTPSPEVMQMEEPAAMPAVRTLAERPAPPPPAPCPLQIVPWQYQPPWSPPPWLLPPPPTTMFCCHVYRAWHNSPHRKGRPPHAPHCHVRIGQTKKKKGTETSGI